MQNTNDLTVGSVPKTLVKFAAPYLLGCFMQTFYGLVDLFVVGIYDDASTTTAVSIGSQITHMLTVIVVGFAMGVTVHIANALGEKNTEKISKIIGTSIIFFLILAALITTVLLLNASNIVNVMNTPSEAARETKNYLMICFAGAPFIVIFNLISGIFRGMGDSKRPMYFVGVAAIANIVLDFVFIGKFDLGASGAALGTIIGQGLSCLVGFLVIIRRDFGFKRADLRVNKKLLGGVLKVGTPIAMQDGIIQITFIIITVIANGRGLIPAASVGVVEKLISFMFLVPSAFLSAISAITAQNMGAVKPERAIKSLRYGLLICVCFGAFCFIYSNLLPETLLRIFSKDTAVIAQGCGYLKSYSLDCMIAGIHFCFSGYFSGMQRSWVSFMHNVISACVLRVPLSYLLSKAFASTLFPMGFAAPIGSTLSCMICIVMYVYFKKKDRNKLKIKNA